MKSRRYVLSVSKFKTVFFPHFLCLLFLTSIILCYTHIVCTTPPHLTPHHTTPSALESSVAIVVGTKRGELYLVGCPRGSTQLFAVGPLSPPGQPLLLGR